MVNIETFKSVHKQKIDFYKSMIGTKALLLSREYNVLNNLGAIEKNLKFAEGNKINISENNITDASLSNMISKLGSISKLFDVRNAIKDLDLIFDDKNINIYVETQERASIFIAIQNQLIKKKFYFILKILNLVQQEMSTTEITKERHIINNPDTIINLFLEYNNERLAAMLAVFDLAMKKTILYVNSLKEAIESIKYYSNTNAIYLLMPYIFTPSSKNDGKINTSASGLEFGKKKRLIKLNVDKQDKSPLSQIAFNFGLTSDKSVYICENPNANSIEMSPIYNNCVEMQKQNKPCTWKSLKDYFAEKKLSTYKSKLENMLSNTHLNDETTIHMLLFACKETLSSREYRFDYNSCPP